MAATTDSRIVKRGMRNGELPIIDDLVALSGMDMETDEAIALVKKIATLTREYVDNNQPPTKVPKPTSKQIALLQAGDGTTVGLELRFTQKAEDKLGNDINRYALRIKDNDDDSSSKDSVFSFRVSGTPEQLEAKQAPTINDGVEALLRILAPVKQFEEDPVAYCGHVGIDTTDATKLNAGIQRFSKAKEHLDKIINIIGDPGWDALAASLNVEDDTDADPDGGTDDSDE